MTTHGFFSAVAHRDKPDTVLVRARCEEDIRYLASLFPGVEPWEDNGADYLWRLELSKDDWAGACAYFASEISYDNFKSAVKSKKHKSAYMGVWFALLKIQPFKPWSTRRGRDMLAEHLPPVGKSARQSAAAFMETSRGWDAMSDLDDDYLLDEDDDDWLDSNNEVFDYDDGPEWEEIDVEPMTEEEWLDIMREAP